MKKELDYIELFILSMVPIIELRGAIPIGMAMDLNPFLIYITCVLGATVVAMPVILTCRYVLGYMKVKNILTGAVNKVENKIDKATSKLGNISFWGLVVFVGIPLPSSGAWTASMIASMMKLRLGRTMLSILIGNSIAGFIIMLLSSPLQMV